MEGQFYRKIPKKNWLNGFVKKIFKTKRRGIIAILGTIAVIYMLFNNRGVIARIRLEHERRVMIERVRAAEEETKRLQSYLKALEGDKKTIEKVAREKYGMVREGETVYRVKKN
ncbi:MAG TPA: hypothetical protein DCP63_00390 [Bacteroidetes bacterium]|nr:hypothetical protein [Bacteroidota bacterium]